MKKLQENFKQLSLWSMVLFISFVTNSCEENNNLTTESINKTGTYIEKADLTELINKIGDRDLKLIELIKNNSVSMLKTASYQKTKISSSEYYFDTDNIMSLKNDNNQAVYIIPAYKSSNTRDNNIYSISININEDFIDTKLNILEIKSDGTKEYTSTDFGFSISKSKTSKVKDLECYCTVTVSDCTCCSSHAVGGCDHPTTAFNCGICSGATTSGTSVGAAAGTNVTISTVWASSAGYGYTYNLTGSSIYIGLTKKFNPDYIFSSLQKLNITNSPEISGPLLDFLNTDGSTRSNKNFVISAIDAIEEGTVTNYQEVSLLLNAYKIVKVSLLIENQIDDTLLDTCLKGIMGQLKTATNADIASVMTKLGAKNDYIVTMKMGTMQKPGNYAETIKVSKNNYLVTVTQNDFTTASKLYKATALLHETIHAYMLSVVDDYNTYPTNAPFTDFPELFNTYVNKISPTFNANFAQHEDMANKYVNAIASALEEYQWNDTGIPSSLADKQVFLDMAWSGLQGTDVFNNKFPAGSADRIRIDARVGAEQNGVYSQGQYAIGKQCN